MKKATSLIYSLRGLANDCLNFLRSIGGCCHRPSHYSESIGSLATRKIKTPFFQASPYLNRKPSHVSFSILYTFNLEPLNKTAPLIYSLRDLAHDGLNFFRIDRGLLSQAVLFFGVYWVFEYSPNDTALSGRFILEIRRLNMRIFLYDFITFL